MKTRAYAIAVALLSSVCACKKPTMGTVSEPPRKPEPTVTCNTPQVGSTPLARLTRREYDNTARDLLGEDRRLAELLLPPDSTNLGFSNAVPVTPAIALLHQELAEQLATRAVEDLNTLLPCDPGVIGEAVCARQFIETLGLKAFRSPVTTAQVDAVFGVYTAAEASGDAFGDRIRQVLQAILQSPYFLYRLELDPATEVTGPAVAPLNAYQIAVRLSYLLWASMPDQALFDAAAANKLQTADEIEAQARRMLDDPRAKQAIPDFFLAWFDVDTILDVVKDTEKYPEFDDELREAMHEETRAFVEHVLWEDDAKLKTLLTATYSFVNGRLANFYGLDGVSSDTFVQRELGSKRSPGILGHASLLAALASPSETSPVMRGHFVRTKLLCQTVSDPPPGLIVVPPDPKPGLTTRELYIEHTQDPYCASCHRALDPIGFGFENFDSVGLFQSEEQGKPIDATGELVFTRDIDGPFDGLNELAERLAMSEEVRDCVASNWFRYAFGRSPTDDDACSEKNLLNVMDASNNNLRELIVALTRTDAFRYRRATEVQ